MNKRRVMPMTTISNEQEKGDAYDSLEQYGIVPNHTGPNIGFSFLIKPVSQWGATRAHLGCSPLA